ncbi:MAG TPA: hypothetical protein VKP59_00095 [Candidatus Thermoplasmatota archaeon]|nr:hypothetical protein [Candidatus Thermoplasmatota archaeon]
MPKSNTELVKSTLFALCKVSGRRTSESFAFKVMNTIVDSLKQRYDFFNHVTIKGMAHPGEVYVSSTIDTVDSTSIYKAIETMIRIVHMDLLDDAGLYFVKEFKQEIERDTLFDLVQHGIDLTTLEMEQQHVYQYRQEKKNIAQEASLLGYTWKDVSNWKYDDMNNVCILYDTNDSILDKLNLDAIIKEHIDRLTGPQEIEDISGLQTERYEKEFELLHLLHEKDLDIDTTLSLLQVSEEDLEHMIERLLNLGLLEYVDFDVVKLSKKGIKYIEQKN